MGTSSPGHPCALLRDRAELVGTGGVGFLLDQQPGYRPTVAIRGGPADPLSPGTRHRTIRVQVGGLDVFVTLELIVAIVIVLLVGAAWAADGPRRA